MAKSASNSSTQPVMVITGTSRGAGQAMARYFAEAGYAVAGCSRGISTIHNCPNYHHYQVDVCEEQMVRVFARSVKKDLGRVDVLVCNVGLVKLGAVTGATSLAMFNEFLSGILVSTFLVCREFSKLMAVQKNGRIINITSIMSELHAPGTCAYGSAKKAVVEFTKILAREVVNYGVTCNVVSPSLIDTESSNSFGDEWEEKMLMMQTIQRPVQVAEICHLIEFFAAPASACLTGQVLHTCFVD